MSTTEDTDNQLVERVKRGDKRAFDLLVMKYQHKIVGLVSRYVRDSDEVLDVTQEAFIKAYRAIPRFRGIALFIPGFIELRLIRPKIISYRSHVDRLIQTLMYRMGNFRRNPLS